MFTKETIKAFLCIRLQISTIIIIYSPIFFTCLCDQVFQRTQESMVNRDQMQLIPDEEEKKAMKFYFVQKHQPSSLHAVPYINNYKNTINLQFISQRSHYKLNSPIFLSPWQVLLSFHKSKHLSPFIKNKQNTSCIRV